ncbi:unnamed protein product, partial [Symbiodinium necroappetens]
MVVGVRILEQALRQRKLGTDGSRQAREELSRKRWISELAVIIREAGLPAASRIDSMSNPETSWVRAFGSRRAKTLKNRAMAWRELGAIDTSSRHWVGYASFGRGAELEQDAAPVKQAPMYPIIVLLACELVVCDPSACLGARFYSSVLLLLVWATLRVDDLQNFNPASVLLSQIGLKFTLDRTKTSGAGKHVGKLRAFVMRGISLSGFDWIGYGYRLLGTESLKFERDYFCGRFGEDWSTNGKWTYVRDNMLLPEVVIPYFTDHSGRLARIAFVPSSHNGRYAPRPLRDDRASEENFFVKQCLKAAAAQNQACDQLVFVNFQKCELSFL